MGMGVQSRLFNLQWLEENLGYEWTMPEEIEGKKVWDDSALRLTESYPSHAFLLIVRDYIMGIDAKTEGRLRKLIPLLSGLGDSSLTLSALVLLGIFVMENGKKSDVVDTVVQQVSKELKSADHSMECVLYHYLQGQIAVKAGHFRSADELYHRVLSQPLETYAPLNFLLGRMYQKIGLYVLRIPHHDLQGQWSYKVNEWCRQYPNSPLTEQLRWLEQTQPEPNQWMHPLLMWRMHNAPLSTPDLHSTVAKNYSVDTKYLNCREMELIWALVLARDHASTDALERVRVAAEAYGDPFWIAQINTSQSSPALLTLASPAKPSVEIQESALHFTYFDTFQGYTSSNVPLFAPTYTRRKVRLLLAFLLLQPRFRMVRDQLLVQLFGEDSSVSEGNYLHVTLHRLRQLLSSSTGVRGDWVKVQEGMVVLNEDRIALVDIDEYRKLADAGHELWRVDRTAACEFYVRAVNMYHPVIAPEFEYEDWMAELRVVLDQQQRRMLRRLWQEERHEGRLDSAVQWGEQLLTLDSGDLSVLDELCNDWHQVGDLKTMHQACARTFEYLRKEGDPIPSWLKSVVKDGPKAFKKF